MIIDLVCYRCVLFAIEPQRETRNRSSYVAIAAELDSVLLLYGEPYSANEDNDCRLR